MKKFESRESIIKRLRMKGFSLHKIGLALGLTGESVRLLERRLGYPPRGRQIPVFEDRKCGNPKCLKVMHIRKCRPKKYCSLQCCKEVRPPARTIEEKKAYYRVKSLKYYHKVVKRRPDFHEYIKKHNDRAYKKRLCLKKKR